MPVMLTVRRYTMETVHHFHPRNWPASVQVAVLTIILVLTIYWFRRRRTFSDFPMIALDGKSAKDTWLYNGRQAVSEGVKLVRLAHRHTLMQAY